MPIAAIGLGVGLVGAIGKMVASGKANKQLNQLVSQDPTYAANPIASQRLSLAQSLLSARAPGAAYAESNIYGTRANRMADVGRNAMSGSQALAAGASADALTNKSFLDLQEQEDKDYQRRYANEVSAQEGQIQEGDKVYQDQVRRFEDLAKIRGAQNQNTQNAWQSLSSLGFGIANAGMSSGMSGGMAGGTSGIFSGIMGSGGTK